ncbi:hypothetical protein AB0I22_38745 [Streptomyces sp. NPDC050610]|uniref:hypothetical protein n=1 Tax=Streptomyces sp. NPDC050610 TaxID=3157097 RepID=UPI00342A38E8
MTRSNPKQSSGRVHGSPSEPEPISADERWEPCSADTNLGMPPDQGTPGWTPHGEDLNLHLGWHRFEKLLLAVSRGVLGLRGIKFRRYGVLGQAQHGIDLAGRAPDGRYTVVQCKDYQEFTAGDLRAAVGKYVMGRRPFGAACLIVATSASTETTQVAEALDELQREHPDLELDLWGSEQINDHLRNLGNVVAQFWTRETAETFCTGAPLPGVPVPLPDRQEQAERILIGPLRVNDVAPILRQADDQLKDAPEESARLYGDLANRLDHVGFRGHAVTMRSKQLAALTDAQLTDQAAALAAHLAVAALHFGDRYEPRRLMSQLEKLEHEATAATTQHAARTKRHSRLVAAAVRSLLHPTGTCDTLKTTLSEESSEAPDYQPLLVLLLAEHVLALAPDRLEDLDSLIQTAIRSSSVKQIERVTMDADIRLRLVRAEYNPTERIELNRLARSHRVPGRHAALIHAREARRCALEGRPDEALESWRDAVSEAVHAGINEDAADWLYAIRAVNVQYGPITPEIDDEHRLAQALRATGDGRLLDRIRSPRQQALSALVAGKPVEAVLSAQRWITDTVITGSWASEIEAAEFLGDLYRDSQEPALAAENYERAGDTKKIKKLAAEGDLELPSGPLDNAPWWTICARAALIESQADLIADDAAGPLLGTLTALAEQGRAGELMDSPFGDLTHQATKSACALAARGTSSQASALLELLASDVPRGANQYHYSDQYHATACLDIAKTHPNLAAVALTRLFDLAEGGAKKALELVVEDDVVEILTQRQDHSRYSGGHSDRDLSEAELVSLRARIDRLDDNGLYLADVARSLVAPGHPAVHKHAGEAFKRIVQRPEPDPGCISFSTRLVNDSYLVGSLGVQDRTLCLTMLMRIAGDAREVTVSRKDALVGACNLVTRMSTDVRRETFQSAKSFVLGEQPGSYLDHEVTGVPHPLSSIKITTGSASLRGKALLLASASATSPEDQAWVRTQAIGLLTTDDSADLLAAATALSRLSSDVVDEVDASLMAAHSHLGVRQASAVLCFKNPDRYRDTALQLARDSDFRVRRVLAQVACQASSEGAALANQILGLLARDPRHSVRTAARCQHRA